MWTNGTRTCQNRNNFISKTDRQVDRQIFISKCDHDVEMIRCITKLNNDTSKCNKCIGGKGKGRDTCYSATYISQTRDQQHFTISEVAANWHEPMVPQHIMWPSIARTNGQLHPRWSQQTHHRAHQPHQAFTNRSPQQVSYYSFHVPLRVGG